MLTFSLNTTSAIPLYEQIYQEIKERIRDGSLPSAFKLPSSRALSCNLGVSRNTVDTAYYQLQAEGYIRSAPRSGFYVCDIEQTDSPLPLPSKNAPRSNAPLAVQQKNSLQATTPPDFQYDFSPYAIDISHFPFSVWQRLSRQVLSDERELFLLGDNQGDAALRAAICDYVCLSREVSCLPEQIIVGAGVDYLLQMLSLTLRALSLTQITMENPGYTQAAHIFQNNALKVSPGALDEQGLTISSVSAGSHLVYVTPSHQFPVGTVMPFGRRRELLRWAGSAPERYIIEDDHDSEFRYRGKPIPSLQGMDGGQHVIYIGTFSKAIAPAIRVGYLILPENLLKIYQKVCGHYSCTVSRIDQAILTHFLSDGYFEKHINRMRKIYRSKHDLAIECLQPLIQKYNLRLQGEHAGLHLTVSLPPDGIRENTLIQNAKKAGIRLYGIHSHYLFGTPMIDCHISPSSHSLHKSDGILLGYSNLTEEDIKKGICLMADAGIFAK